MIIEHRTFRPAAGAAEADLLALRALIDRASESVERWTTLE